MISVVENRGVRCALCRAASSQPVWLAIDLIERPDLRAYLSGSAWLCHRCERCGGATPRREPLLVTRLDDIAPVLLGLPIDQAYTGSPPPETGPLVERVRLALGDELQNIPGPIVGIPHDALRLAAMRDVSGDVHAIDRVRHQLPNEPQAAVEHYERFLRRLVDSSPLRRMLLALNRLKTVANAGDLARLIEAFPELTDETTRAYLDSEAKTQPDATARQYAEAELRLVEHAAQDGVEAAWAEFEATASSLWDTTLTPRVHELTSAIDDAKSLGDWAGMAENAEALLELVKANHIENIEVAATAQLADALYSLRFDGGAECVERAISLYEWLLDEAGDRVSDLGPLVRAGLYANYGAALGTRLRGDPLDNVERAIACLRHALDLLPHRGDDGLRVVAHTNLGLCLLYRAREHWTLDMPDGSVILCSSAMQDTREAIRHLRLALRSRTQKLAPGERARVHANLGIAFVQRSRRSSRSDLRRALAHLQKAVQGSTAAGDAALQANALRNLSAVQLAISSLPATRGSTRRRLLSDATATAEASVQVGSTSVMSTEAGLAWKQLGDVLSAANNSAEAIHAYRRALEMLTPVDATRPCREAAQALAARASDAGDWETSADAWEIAVTAAEQARTARATAAGRFAELQGNMTVFRWAGYALARAGRLRRAVEVLESGRAQELAIRLRDDTDSIRVLQSLDPALCTRFNDLESRLADVESREQFAMDVQPGLAGPVAEELHEVVQAIQALPGLESFRKPYDVGTIAPGLDNTEALAYLVATPHGSMALVVSTPDRRELTINHVHAAALTSAVIVRRLFDVETDPRTLSGYMGALDSSDHLALDEALSGLADLIAPQLLKPLAMNIADTAISRLTLIPTGLLGLLPLHTLPWQDGEATRCLLDSYDVVLAPSACVRMACQQQARTLQAKPRHAVIVGNPLPHTCPLPGAEREARMVAGMLADAAADLMVGTAATKSAVIEALPLASHVHFACHGTASFFDDAMSSGLSLANDEILAAREIIDLYGFEPRLVVASACDTAVIHGYETSDEALSLASILLGAGAAGVVATLWAIDDYATALLMSRFYEALLASDDPGNGMPDPAHALRQAQLWLRDLTDTEEQAYLATRPELRAHREWRRARGDDGADVDSVPFPYGDITVWSAFVFHGA